MPICHKTTLPVSRRGETHVATVPSGLITDNQSLCQSTFTRGASSKSTKPGKQKCIIVKNTLCQSFDDSTAILHFRFMYHIALKVKKEQWYHLLGK